MFWCGELFLLPTQKMSQSGCKNILMQKLHFVLASSCNSARYNFSKFQFQTMLLNILCLIFLSNLAFSHKTIVPLKNFMTLILRYGRNDCCPTRLMNLNIYLGNDWTNFENNQAVARAIDVSQWEPLEVFINARGRYLWIVKDTSKLTICEIEIWARCNK